jgi:hypothetical protein
VTNAMFAFVLFHKLFVLVVVFVAQNLREELLLYFLFK